MNKWTVFRAYDPRYENIFSAPDTHKVIARGNLRASFFADGRFEGDCAFFEDGNELLLLDGVILNSTELKEAADVSDMPSLVSALKKEDPLFFRRFIGPFCGVVADTESDSLSAFGNQTGDGIIFYYNDRHFCAVSNDFLSVLELCKKAEVPLTFNPVAANQILSMGCVVEGNTYVSEIHKSNPGKVVTLSRNGATENIYHRFSNKPKQMTLDEAVERVDSAFQKAVKRCFDKDLEYGYSHHLADMSGGLDSRMTSFVAKKLGYDNITNISYSKNGSQESEYARLAAEAMGNEWQFRSLDGVEFIYDVDSIVKKNYGLAYYAGITGGERFLAELDFKKFGLEHTGQLGLVLSSYSDSPDEMRALNADCMVLTKGIDPMLTQTEEYENNEIFTKYLSGFQKTLTTHFVRRHYTTAVAPFIDVEFMETCLEIPLEYRCGHKLYWAWLDKKHPDAAAIPTTRQRPASRAKKEWAHIKRGVKNRVRRMLKKLGLVRSGYASQNMNPFDFWYDTKPEMRDFVENYFKENIAFFDYIPETKKLLEDNFVGKKVSSKLTVLTVLAAAKNFF